MKPNFTYKMTDVNLRSMTNRIDSALKRGDKLVSEVIKVCSSNHYYEQTKYIVTMEKSQVSSY